MDVREKLIEILEEPCGGLYKACELADYLLDNGVTVQGWISVEDKLPEQPPNRADAQGRSWFTQDIDCIVYDGKIVFAAHYCFQNKCFWYADTLHPLNNITHWMPPPQPPTGE